MASGRLQLLSLLAAVLASDAFRVAVVPRGGLRPAARASSPLMQDDEAPPVADSPPAPEPPITADTPLKPGESFETRGKFLGVFDVTTPSGALFASIIVSGGFGLLVEFIKFLDPNNVGDPSIFGSLSTM